VKKACLVLLLVLCCALVVDVAGCGSEAANTWSKLDAGGDVPSSLAAYMVCDSDSGKVILCGEKFDGAFLVNNWVYELSTDTWTDLGHGVNAPPERSGQAVVYDSRSEKVILFGGGRETLLNDTWAYDPSVNTWTELDPAGDVPSPRSGHSMVYDSRSGRLLLFGGCDGNRVFGDTWGYDPSANAWGKLEPTGESPPGRVQHSMVYDLRSSKVILFGGMTTEGAGDDTWAYDPTANTWTELHPAGNSPPPRSGHSMVYDSRSDRVILFGGWNSGSPGVLNDTWAYEAAANTWTELSPGGNLPAARGGHAMVYESVSGKVVLFGGRGSSRLLFDTWVYGINP
jgi:N-acetylneuraminic acid mutarotase